MYSTRNVANLISQLPTKSVYYLKLENSKNTYSFKIDFTRDTIISIQPGVYHVTNTVRDNIYELDIHNELEYSIDTYVEIVENRCYILPAKYTCSVIAVNGLECDHVEFNKNGGTTFNNGYAFKYSGYILYVVSRKYPKCHDIYALLFPRDNKFEKTKIKIDNIEHGKYYILHLNESNNTNGFNILIDPFVEGTL